MGRPTLHVSFDLAMVVITTLPPQFLKSDIECFLWLVLTNKVYRWTYRKITNYISLGDISAAFAYPAQSAIMSPLVLLLILLLKLLSSALLLIASLRELNLVNSSLNEGRSLGSLCQHSCLSSIKLNRIISGIIDPQIYIQHQIIKRNYDDKKPQQQTTKATILIIDLMSAH